MTNISSKSTGLDGEQGGNGLEVLYLDEYLVAINKPTGLLVHRSPIDRHETRFALQLVRDQMGKRVYPLHRLDKPTSGVLVFAFSPEVAALAQQSMAAPSSQKDYLAVVRGYCPDTSVDHPITDEHDTRVRRSPGAAKAALTHIHCLATIELDIAIETYPQSRYSLVRAQPVTGRRHQIRRHLKHIAHPIIGDAKHGRGRHNRYFAEHFGCGRLLLHAQHLRLVHPINGESLSIEAPLDDQFSALLDRFGWGEAVSADGRESGSSQCPARG